MIGVGSIVDGKYELVSIAGQGGMATVFRAQVRGAAGFARSVAIKRMRPEFRDVQSYIDMFVEEARVGAELAHPNIVQVYDFATDADGAYYLVMEWVDGIDMSTWLGRHASAGKHVPWPLAVSIVLDTLRGLGAAHERRRADGTLAPVVHRDVSPHNVLVGTSGVAKLSDFGLARARDRVAKLTAPGTVKGKLAYMAPEVSHGAQASPRSDLFAVGCMLWEALAGHRPFEGKNDIEVFRKIRECNPAPLAPLRPDVPPALIDIINRTLTKSPDDRFQSAALMAQALREVVQRTGHDVEGAPAVAASVRELLGANQPPPPPALHSATTEVKTDEATRPAATRPQPPAMHGDDDGSIDVQFSVVDVPIPPSTKR